MRSILFGGAARRWSLSVALLAGLATLIVSLAATANAQDNPRPPHWFWGVDMNSYVGDQVIALNQNGVQVGSSDIDNQGRWAVTVSPDEARMVTLRLVTDSGNRETDPLDVIDGGFDPDGLSISEFTHRTSEEVEDLTDTIPVEIRARVYPSSENPEIPFRSIEFNLSVDGVAQELNDNPRERTIRPNHASGRWYRSNWFDLGNGFRAAIIACKDQNDGVRFGVRVDGRDDIIPRLNLLSGSRTSTRWAVSNEVNILRPGDDLNPSRAGRGDTNCLFGKDN